VDNEALAAATLDELWLACQQRLVGHIAHDLKGALNGASVNMEVVRSRAERPDAKVTDIGPYATAAGDQLAIVIRMTTALLNLTRPVRGPVEAATIGKTLAGLMEESFRIAGAKLDVTAEGGLSGATRAPATAIRLALGELFLLAAQQKMDLSVRLLAIQPPTLEVKSDAVLALRAEVLRALTGSGIVVKTAGHGISIVLPSPT
jgi:hypothetical protein